MDKELTKEEIAANLKAIREEFFEEFFFGEKEDNAIDNKNHEP